MQEWHSIVPLAVWWAKCQQELPLTPTGVMSEANSGMTLHSLVLISDSFSLHCNSIQSPVSIVHLRVILTYLIPLLRVYINQHSSSAIQFKFQLVQQCIQISTRINILQCTYEHLRLFYIACIQKGFVDPKCNKNQLKTFAE